VAIYQRISKSILLVHYQKKYMNLIKNTLIILFLSAAAGCSGSNQSNSAAVLADNTAAIPNSAANTVNTNNADPNKAQTDVYKDYPADVNPKTVVSAEKSKDKKLTPAKQNSANTETVKKTDSPSSNVESEVFKFNSSRRINSAARTLSKRRPPVNANVTKDETKPPEK
jgi:hypothetical protein